MNIAPLTAASKTGVPALERFLDASVPWLARLKPYLGNFVPIFNYINTYRREIAAFFANSTATTQATAQNIAQTRLLHYLRISNPVNPETLTGYPHRLDSNRGNPYMAPGGYAQLLQGLSVFGSYLCTATRSRRSARRFPLTSSPILQNVYYTQDAGWAAVQGAGSARRGDHRAASSLPTTQTPAMSTAGAARRQPQPSQLKGETLETETRSHHHGAGHARRRDRQRTRRSTPTRQRPAVSRRASARRPSRSASASRRRCQAKNTDPTKAAASLTRDDVQDLRPAVERQALPDLQRDQDGAAEVRHVLPDEVQVRQRPGEHAARRSDASRWPTGSSAIRTSTCSTAAGASCGSSSRRARRCSARG